jgi:signal transduction histidine kinase
LLSFRDNDCGIAPENLDRIEPYFTTRLGQGGSGPGCT